MPLHRGPLIPAQAPSAAREPSPAGGIPAAVAIRRGIDHCRRGEWSPGLRYLAEADSPAAEQTLPGLYYTYLGHALARMGPSPAVGVGLCEGGLAAQPGEPENALNLAHARLLARDKRGAAEALDRGLALAPGHAGFEALQRELGRRRAPVLGFLPRSHPVNRWLGRLRHAYRLWRASFDGTSRGPDDARIWQAL